MKGADLKEYRFDPVVPYLEQLRKEEIRAEQKSRTLKELRRQGNRAGLAVLAFIGLQFFLMFPISFLNGLGSAASDPLFQSAFGAVFSFVCLFLPFLYVYKKMSPAEKQKVEDAFEKPKTNFLMLVAIPAGFMFCMAGNYIVGYLVSLMDSVGVELSSPEPAVPSGFLGALVYVLQIAFLPALIEEFALRGVVMQPLRRYGDGFAIFVTALVFALMHGNMVQAPFALIAGLAIGYFSVATGSVWTGVLIHFANNLFSALLSLINGSSSFVSDNIYAAFMSLSFVAGLACCVLFFLSPKRIRLEKSKYKIGLALRGFKYFSGLPMLIALAAIAYITSDYIRLK